MKVSDFSTQYSWKNPKNPLSELFEKENRVSDNCFTNIIFYGIHIDKTRQCHYKKGKGNKKQKQKQKKKNQ